MSGCRTHATACGGGLRRTGDVTGVDWADRRVNVNVTRDQVRSAPAFDPSPWRTGSCRSSCTAISAGRVLRRRAPSLPRAPSEHDGWIKPDAHIVDRPGLPFLGAGEAGQDPAAAAIANAIADATGQRLRDLPLTAANLKAAVGI
jgi:hypothetical protein